MADYFVRPAVGLDTNDGLSWATAKATLGAAIGLAVGGSADRIFMSNVAAESSSVARTLTSLGTPASPVGIYSVDETLPTPNAVVPGAGLAGTGTINLHGSFAVYGLSFSAGNGGGTAAGLALAASSSVDCIQSFNDCSLFINNTGTNTAPRLNIGSSTNTNSARSRVVWNNCTVRLGGLNHVIQVYQELLWRGGAYSPWGSTPPSQLFNLGVYGRSCPLYVEGVDLSLLPATTNLVSGNNSTGRAMFRNCVLPAGWTGQLVSGVIDPGLRAEMHNCDSGDTNYRLWVMAFSGEIVSDTSVVRTGGASNGVTPFSMRMKTNTNPTPGVYGLESPELPAVWNTTIDVPVTVSVDILNGTTLLTTADVWLEVQYPGTNGLPKSSFVSGRVAPLVSPEYVPGGSAAWATPGVSTPYKQKLSVTFTPREAGAIQARVVLARPSAELYVDAKLQVT